MSVTGTKFKTKWMGSSTAGPEYETLNLDVHPYDI
jgi:hypothetical protein